MSGISRCISKAWNLLIEIDPKNANEASDEVMLIEPARIKHALIESPVRPYAYAQIIDSTFVGITKNLIGLTRLFELLFSRRVIRISIWMPPHLGLAPRRFDFVRASPAFDLESLVVVHRGDDVHKARSLVKAGA